MSTAVILHPAITKIGLFKPAPILSQNEDISSKYLKLLFCPHYHTIKLAK